MEDIIEGYAKRIGYNEQGDAKFYDKGHRIRQVNRLVL